MTTLPLQLHYKTTKNTTGRSRFRSCFSIFAQAHFMLMYYFILDSFYQRIVLKELKAATGTSQLNSSYECNEVYM